MDRFWKLSLGLAVLLSACQLPVESPTGKSSTAPLRRAPSNSPTSGTSAFPSLTPSLTPSAEASAGTETAAVPSASPSATPGAGSVLRRPDGATRLVAGRVAIDAHYAHAIGAGRIVSNGGNQAIVFGAASIVSNGGGNLISDNGASLIGKVKAPTIGILSNNGGNHIANDGQAYRILQAAPTLGELLPAAGLTLRVGSLRTGDFLPVGVDPAGKPVYEVFSDAAGHYELYLPATELNNVLLVAHAPGSEDARLGFSLVVPEAQEEQALDDDTSLVTSFLRTAFAEVLLQDVNLFLDRLETQTLEQVAGLTLDAYPEAMREDVREGRIRWLTAALAAGARSYTPAQRRSLAQRMNDTILAYMDLDKVRTDYPKYSVTLPETGAVPGLVEELRRQRESVSRTFQRLKSEQVDARTYFSARPYVQKAETTLGVSFAITTPADAIAFTIYGILANIQMTRTDAYRLYEEAVTSAEFGMPAGTSARVFSSTQPIYAEYLRAFYYDPEVGAAIVKEAGKPVDPM